MKATLKHQTFEPFKVVFDDECILIVEKIAKIVVQPTAKVKITLTSLIRDARRCKVFPCHRLDRETTGLIIYAKAQKYQKDLADQFRQNKVKKKYLAFISGTLSKQKGEWQSKIIDKDGARFGEKAKQAKTFYRVLKEYSGWSLIELMPVTGRTNQLRIHLAQAGHPILGERKYAFGRDFKVRFKRLALHACFISFLHPVTGKRQEFELDLPPDMKTFLDRASQKAL